MKVPFNSPARKGLIAVLALLFAAAYVALAARQFAASWLSGRTELTSLKWAARLDPADADYRNHLGRYYDLVARDPVAAIANYQAAVALNPHSARFWFDLASAYQVLGDTSNQALALDRAIQADSMTPDVAWEAANLYLVQGDNEKALHEFRVVMANDASLAGTALQFCWRMNPDVDLLLHDVVPPTPDAYRAFLSLLETKQDTAGTFKVWDALQQTRQPFEKRDAYDYIRFLILHKEVDQAVVVWQQTANRFGLSDYLPSRDNLVVDGTFSLNVLNNGFDWQYQKQTGVKMTLDDTESHGGGRSLMIAFDGPGINDAGIYQFVPVEPNSTYEFTAHYKNKGDLEGAGGPHFTVQDMYSQAIYYESGELRDAETWKTVDGEFKTGPDCKLVVLHLRRVPAGSPIRGKLWVSDFRIARKPS